MIIVVVYVYDIIFTSDLQIVSVNFSSDMNKEFEISLLGELTFFLGLQVYQSEKWIFILQNKYIKAMLKKFKLEDSNSVSTPMVTNCKLSKDDDSLEVYHTMYIYMIGRLLYVTATRPDVMQVVGLVARFQSILKETHVNIVERILKYLKGTMDYGLWYPKSQ